jgi:hypothetical protein
VNSRGDVLVAWQTGAPEQRGSVVVRRRPAGGAWGKATKISGGLQGGSPVLAMDGKGRAVVTWSTDQEATQPQIVVATFVPGKGWAKPRQLTKDPDAGYAPAVAIAAGVVSLTFVKVKDSVDSGVVFLRRSDTGRWSAPRRLSPVGLNAAWPTVGLNGARLATVVFSQRTATGSRVAERHETAAGRWSSPVFLSPDVAGQVTRTTLAEVRDGTALVLWAQDAGAGTNFVQMAHRDGSLGTFTDPVALSPTTGYQVRDLVVSANATDDVFTMGWWVGGDYRVRRRNYGGSLGSQQTMGLPGNTGVGHLSLATDAQQTTYAVWSEGSAGSTRIASSQLSIVGLWTTHEWISPTPAGADYVPAVAVAQHRPAAVVWLRRVGSTDRVKLREFDPLT